MVTGIWIVSFIFLCGLVAGGLVGAWLELRCGRRLAFAEPFISRDRLLRSIAATVVTGPFMLLNEALDAFRARRVGLTTVLSSAALSLTWVFLTGIVVADLAIFLRGLLT
jgi:hypothetical protein